jgi:hypothetical protein
MRILAEWLVVAQRAIIDLDHFLQLKICAIVFGVLCRFCAKAYAQVAQTGV